MSSWGIYINDSIIEQQFVYTGKVLGIDDNGNLIYVMTQSLVVSWAETGWWTGENYWTSVGNNIYSNNTGNVGIGTNTPAGKLHLTSSGSTELYITENNDSNAANINLENNASVWMLWWYEDRFYIGIKGTSVINILTGWYVGIGTTGPTEALEVNGKVKIGNALKLYSAATYAYIESLNQIRFNTSWANTRMIINASWNIWIWTSTPTGILDVNWKTKTTSLQLQIGATINEFSTNTGLSENSDQIIPTQKAVKTYIDNVTNTTIDVRHAVTFSSYFTNGWASGHRPLSYKKDKSGQFILINGDAKRIINNDGSHLVFTLPIGYRPIYRTQWVILSSRADGESAIYDIETGGNVSVYRPATFLWNYVAFNIIVPLD